MIRLLDTATLIGALPTFVAPLDPAPLLSREHQLALIDHFFGSCSISVCEFAGAAWRARRRRSFFRYCYLSLSDNRKMGFRPWPPKPSMRGLEPVEPS